MKKEITRNELEEVIKKAKSNSDVCRALDFPLNGSGFRKVKNLISENNFDVSHFGVGESRRKYELIEKKCPVCETKFITKKGHSKEQLTCSYKCSNTFFRSGVDNPNWKDDSYRSTCFLYHEKKCVICGEDKILDVHHFDENKKNNSPENLIPICPTHHMYWHSRYKNEVYDKVVEYRNMFINNRDVD
jgi:hypothetical protein